MTYCRKCRYGRYRVRHSQTPDLALHVYAVKYGVLCAVGLRFEIYMYVRQSGLEGLGIGSAVGADEACFKCEERHGAIHRSGVDIAVADCRGKAACHSAFA